MQYSKQCAGHHFQGDRYKQRLERVQHRQAETGSLGVIFETDYTNVFLIFCNTNI